MLQFLFFVHALYDIISISSTQSVNLIYIMYLYLLINTHAKAIHVELYEW